MNLKQKNLVKQPQEKYTLLETKYWNIVVLFTK